MSELPKDGYYIAKVQLDTGGQWELYIRIKDGKPFTTLGVELLPEACSELREVNTARMVRAWPEDAAMELDALRTANAGLVEKVKRLEEAGDTCQDTLLRADNDIREHLQVANYNLHGLLNTGERIAPPNPPQTIHQAGVDASAAVRTAIKFAFRIWDKAKGQP